MPLSSALSIAQNALFNTARQTAVVSRNVSEAGDPDYARRRAMLESTAPGARVVVVQRSVEARLFRLNADAVSVGSAQATLYARVDELKTVLNGADGETALSHGLQELQDALQTASADPSNTLVVTQAINAAKDVANGITAFSSTVQDLRIDADREIAATVGDLNRLLNEFGSANDAIVNARRMGSDVNDALDRRDALLKQISVLTPVTVRVRAGDDMVLSTSGGTTLFETLPRVVTFTPTAPLAPGTVGNGVRVDGVPLSAGEGAETSARGSIAALLQLRDQVAPRLQSQGDEIARGLISAFAETDQTASASPPLAGLFRSTLLGSAVPPAGVLISGLAASLEINPAIDPYSGGNPALLRDGGANGAAYVANAAGSPGFSSRLIALAEAFDAPLAFDPAAGLSASATLNGFAAQSEGWLEGFRAAAAASRDEKTALQARLAESLSNATGVNVDEEMSALLQLEQSYEASARLISVVDRMLATLLDAAR